MTAARALAFCLIALASSALAQPADAQRERLAGNTLSIENRFGVIKLRLHPDMTYSYAVPGGGSQKGTWRVFNGALCTTAVDPAPPPDLPAESCLLVRDRRIGERWGGNDVRNGPIRYKLSKGD